MRVATRADNPLEFVGMLGGMAPAPLFEAYFGLMAARTIMAGTKLGVFAALAESADDAEGLAKRLGGDRDGLDVLLVALHSMRYLDQAGDGTYTPSKIATRHLVPDASKPLAEVTGSFAYDMWDAFSRLETAIETGEPIGLHEDDPDDPYWGRYMRALFELAELRSADLCRLIKTDRPRRLLDLAGGHGGYSVAMCRRHADLTAKVVELDGAARIGREIVAEAGFGERISYQVGDMFDFTEAGAYDVAMANSILHHFEGDRNVELLRVARAALRPGGTMAVIEQERPPEGRRGSQIGALTGVLFFITSKSRTWSAEELTGFFKRAGFERVKARRTPSVPGVVVVTGR